MASCKMEKSQSQGLNGIGDPEQDRLNGKNNNNKNPSHTSSYPLAKHTAPKETTIKQNTLLYPLVDLINLPVTGNI